MDSMSYTNNINNNMSFTITDTSGSTSPTSLTSSSSSSDLSLLTNSYFGNNTLFDSYYNIDLYSDSNTYNDSNTYSNTSDELFMLYMSYNVKSLVQIMNYYNININNKKKLVKDEIIQLLIFFELDEANISLVNKRRRLWKNMNELCNDKYFKNYIMCKL